MRIQQANTIIRTSSGTLCGEASTLGMRGFPSTVIAPWEGRDRFWDRTYKDDYSGDDLAGVYYRERGGPLMLLIVND
jgi:hypothetical protein